MTTTDITTVPFAPATRPGRVRFAPGLAVTTADGSGGEVDELILGDDHRRLSHLVVRPRGRYGPTRLVPLAAVASGGDHVALSWSTAELLDAPLVEHHAGVAPHAWRDDQDDIGIRRPLVWSSFRAPGSVFFVQGGFGRLSTLTAMTYRQLPSGTTELGRGSDVVSRDAHLVGHVGGVVIDLDGGIVEIVVTRGHRWHPREVAVAVDDVASIVSDQVRLTVSRDEVDGYGTRPAPSPTW